MIGLLSEPTRIAGQLWRRRHRCLVLSIDRPDRIGNLRPTNKSGFLPQWVNIWLGWCCLSRRMAAIGMPSTFLRCLWRVAAVKSIAIAVRTASPAAWTGVVSPWKTSAMCLRADNAVQMRIVDKVRSSAGPADRVAMTTSALAVVSPMTTVQTSADPAPRWVGDKRSVRLAAPPTMTAASSIPAQRESVTYVEHVVRTTIAQMARRSVTDTVHPRPTAQIVVKTKTTQRCCSRRPRGTEHLQWTTGFMWPFAAVAH